MIYKLLEAESPLLRMVLPETTAEEIKEKHNLTMQELFDNLKGTMAATGGLDSLQTSVDYLFVHL